MQYAQLNEDGSYSHQITTSGNTAWDENNFCSAAALVKDGKAEQFRVVELHETEPPTIDPLTQTVMRDGGEFVDGRWQYKWRVDALTPAQIEENELKRKLKLRSSLIDATQKRLDSFASGRNYSGILSLCTYATSTNQKFRVEGQYGIEARDATWAKLHEILNEIDVGTRPEPSGFYVIEPELPALKWP